MDKKESFSESFWNKTKKRLYEMNIPLKDFSRIIGMSYGHLLRNIEGNITPQLSRSFYIANALGLSLDFLTGKSGAEKNNLNNFIDPECFSIDNFWYSGSDKTSLLNFLKILSDTDSRLFSFFNVLLNLPLYAQICLFTESEQKETSVNVLCKAFSSTWNDANITLNFWTSISKEIDKKKVSVLSLMKNPVIVSSSKNYKYKNPRLDNAVQYCELLNISIDKAIRRDIPISEKDERARIEDDAVYRHILSVLFPVPFYCQFFRNVCMLDKTRFDVLFNRAARISQISKYCP